MTITMTDHPAWQATPAGACRLVRAGAGLWLAATGADGITLACVAGSEEAKPQILVTDPAALPADTPTALARALGGLGPVARLTNPWLWDAVVTAILRQVVRAEQARALYRAWCTRLGTAAPGVPAGLAICPGPERVLEIPDADYTGHGTAFHRTALQAAAAAYLEHGGEWEQLPPGELAAALDAVPRIGPWTARAAAADYTGDFAIYPHGDLAVRTWAKTAAPEVDWPTKDRPFEAAWRAFAGTDTELHTLTLLTLTRGSHARHDHPHPECP